VHLHNPALTRQEFVEMLAARFGLSERARASKTVFLLELEELLRQRHIAKATTVLIVDEAQSLSLELLEEIRLLSNIETNAEKLLSLVIAGQPELANRFTNQALRQLKQRIALRCDLRPLNLRESIGYMASRIAAAGGTPTQIFSREAVLFIFERSRGIPRTINVIADNALVSGFAAQQRPITTQIIREVCRDFDITQPRAANPQPPSEPKPKGLSPVLTKSDEQVLDSAIAIWPALRARGEKISNWAAPAFNALGVKKR
jgi:type II secretory pathway predicted ATPase ExeA